MQIEDISVSALEETIKKWSEVLENGWHNDIWNKCSVAMKSQNARTVHCIRNNGVPETPRQADCIPNFMMETMLHGKGISKHTSNESIPRSIRRASWKKPGKNHVK